MVVQVKAYQKIEENELVYNDEEVPASMMAHFHKINAFVEKIAHSLIFSSIGNQCNVFRIGVACSLRFAPVNSLRHSFELFANVLVLSWLFPEADYLQNRFWMLPWHLLMFSLSHYLVFFLFYK